jgi:CRISPR-associated protein Cas2
MAKRFDLVACYDVATSSPGGARRLRKMAKACEAYGQRVQYSVFELSVTDALFQRFLSRALNIMDASQDSLRLYFLSGSREESVQVYGVDGWTDFDEPLVV